MINTDTDTEASYNAAFEFRDADVTGPAEYAEPESPFCPTLGSAAGTATIKGPAARAVVRRGPGRHVGAGVVTGVEWHLGYTYQRAGSPAVVTIKGGSVTVSYEVGGGRAEGFTGGVVSGAGTGAFDADLATALARCASPGPLGFRAAGDVALRLR